MRNLTQRNKKNQVIKNSVFSNWIEKIMKRNKQEKENQRIAKLRPASFTRKSNLVNVVIKKNNRITAFDTVVRKGLIEDFQNKGFEIISIQY